MDGLIVYGSLINKMELTRLGYSLESTFPVIVEGFQRIFCQEPSWRKSGQGEERAVLNAISAQERWLNGLLISGLNDDLFIALDKREKGYVRMKVDSTHLKEYDFPHTSIILHNIYIYTGKIDKQSASILPNTSYLDICLAGARQWGENFYNDFLDSTFVKNNIPLRSYLS